MSDLKCVVEGCDLEYDVVCSFSFYNVNSSESKEGPRQAWINGAMQEDSECLWRHVSLQLCGYHFELDSQGLWIDSPMLPELLTPQPAAAEAIEPTEEQKKGSGGAGNSGFQGLFQQFITGKKDQAADMVKMEHNYSTAAAAPAPEPVSRLNVRQLVDTLGYLSLKNLQRKQLWVVAVESDKAEASITQAEQVITKMHEPKQVIEILPQTQSTEPETSHTEELPMMDDTTVSDNFIYEIAEEQEISMDEVSEIPANQEWTVNILPDDSKPKYAFIRHCNTGKKKRHFTADMTEVVQGDFENYYILPDADPSVGVEVTTSYEPENYIVDEYQHLVLEDRPKKRGREPKEEAGKKRKKKNSVREQVKQIQRQAEIGQDWVIENNVAFDQDDSDDYDPKTKARVRRKNKKYVGYDFVT
ncbi:uncharacterized protein LOC105385027 isoform X2 [Plutella xylostella]|uniref:uncharacterized protein LOC105385027 isoform X1 n=1 Tax=Plutella xylostella TaxID=51655 RepID=UPI002032D207|nr:uncharacterized protein LOC105385027 isoform X1 [Plutella xylostella]XP_048480063.1 uncharacterized protein LOC105385027 isoform X2 [Plutella xylostella]